LKLITDVIYDKFLRKKEKLSKETILQVNHVGKILEKIKEIELEKDIHIRSYSTE
jgi:hypothetical protein